MTSDRTVSRRDVLVTAGAGASALVLGACGGTSDGAGTPGGPASSGAAPGSTAAAPGTGSGTPIAKLADIPVGGSLRAEIAGKPVVLAQPSAGTAVCHSAICTHSQCEVTAGGAQLVCHCHGSAFDAATGAVLNGPATSPLPSVAVTVYGDSVVAT